MTDCSFEEARLHRDAWARRHGCTDFVHAMQIGLVAVGRRKEIPDPGLPQAEAVSSPVAEELQPARMPYAD